MPWKGSADDAIEEIARRDRRIEELERDARSTARQMKDATEHIHRLNKQIEEAEPRIKDAEAMTRAVVLTLRQVVFEGLTDQNKLVPSERLVLALVRCKALCNENDITKDWLSPEVTRRLRAAFAFGEPWPITEVLEKLAEAAEILLKDKDYDGHGWELIQGCVPRARIMAASFRQIYVDFLRK